MTRYTESEIMHEALKLLANAPNGRLNTTKLIELLEEELRPDGHDVGIIEGRSDTYFSQKVRNLVSHRNDGSGMVYLGYITYDNSTKPGTLTITEEGRLAIKGR